MQSRNVHYDRHIMTDKLRLVSGFQPELSILGIYSRRYSAAGVHGRVVESRVVSDGYRRSHEIHYARYANAEERKMTSRQENLVRVHRRIIILFSDARRCTFRLLFIAKNLPIASGQYRNSGEKG